MKIAVLRNLRVVRLLTLLFLAATVIFCSAVIGLYFFATPDKIRATLIPLIEERLGYEVEFSGVDVSLFSGVKFTDLEIAEKNTHQTWLQVEEAVLRYQILPLLRGHVVIDELRMHTPSVVVHRNPDGSVSMGDMVHLPYPGADNMRSSGFTPLRRPIDFHISTISISNAEVLVRDFVFGSIPRLTRLQEAGLQLKNFSSEAVWQFTLWGKLNGTPLDVEGYFDPHTHRASIQLVLEGLDMVAFQPYYREQLPFKINRLGVSTRSEVKFDSTGVEVRGEIRFNEADISDIAPFAPTDDTFSAHQVSADIHLLWNSETRQLNLLRMDALMDGLAVGAQGTAHTGEEYSEYAFNIELRQWPLRALTTHTSLPWLAGFEENAPAGTCSALFTWRKDAKDHHGSIRNGRVILADAGLSAGGLRFGLSGEIELEGDSLNAANLNTKIGGENMQASLFSKNWRAPQPRFTLNLQGEKLDAWNLFALTDAQGDSRSSGANVVRAVSEPGPYRVPFDVDVTFELNSIVWRSATLKQARGSFFIRDSELILENLDADFAAGRLRAGARLDLGQQGFSYTVELVGRKLDMHQSISALWPGFSGTLSGRGDLEMNLSGAGTQRLRARQNLSGTLRLSLEQGSIRGVNTLHVLAQRLDINALTRLDFVAARADFRLKTGNSPEFTLLGRNEQLRIFAQGNIDWQGQTCGSLDLHLAPELGKDLAPEFARTVVPDENGWDVVECDFTGEVNRPEFSAAGR